MRFANEYEIDGWVVRFAGDPVLSCAANTLRSLVDATNGCSDGWPYWRAPSRAAQKLVGLLYDAETTWRRGVTPRVSVAQLKLAYRPIKAHCTRYGSKYGFEVEFHYPVAAGQPHGLSLFE